MAECEASRRQAEGATEAAKALLDEQSKKPGDKVCLQIMKNC